MICWPDFDYFTLKKESCLIRYTGCLLHIMRDDDDCVIAFEFKNKIFDARSGSGVESACWLIKENYFWVGSKGPGNTKPLGLTA